MWPRTAMTIRTIGVRQLKNEATQVVRAVREERVVYVITVNGSPVATLRPFSERDIAGVERGEAEAEIAAIAAEHQLRGSDALYFAVAETLGDRLVTLNPRQLQRAGQVVETVRPRPAALSET